jgi:hypothetical protein
MLRTRLSVFALLCSLGPLCGCLNLCDHPLFGHRGDCCMSEGACCGTGCCPGAIEGPALGDCQAPAAPCCPQAINPAPVPTLTTPPRLVPQPQSQPVPYAPPR